ncbi:hypothetical protein FBZ94_10544 [Bradyrhizobium sacchari]|uniref:Uncharacterized protein n=2 Tax=Bradyrhizobium sacchari TaxID=1399419 RepID=A0A560JNW6_9BRAD|nr:hypothetical protein FBZ94_10544 [Bradyrhizobium sacchari]TWB72872.1 hypothetical protein FBZ95_106587 [Bradyrhizobium sacchari]
MTFERAKQEFENAWNNPNHTRFELPPVDVNRVLRERYTVEPAATKMTLTQLWDMETRKAWDPATYIPYVVSRGHSWGRHALEEGCQRFFRTSEQAAWIDPSRGEVIEDVFISHLERRILFLGLPWIVDDRGENLRASNFQPLFHVEHAASGSEEHPINIWRIVVLTVREDDRFKRPFEEMVAAGYLPGFVEEYMRRDMNVCIDRC